MESSISHQVAAQLLQIEAIRLNLENPFTWASGWKSPIYCDNRLSLSYPHIRDFIKIALKSLIQQEFENTEAIAGVATAGIPQGALVADSLSLPFLYVRSKAKGHGLTNMIEGVAQAGQKVVLVEDLISTGGSSLKALDALRDAGCDVKGMAAIFTYGFKVSEENFKKKKCKLVTLSDYDTLIKQALASNYIGEKDLDSLKGWREEPSEWKSK